MCGGIDRTSCRQSRALLRRDCGPNLARDRPVGGAELHPRAVRAGGLAPGHPDVAADLIGDAEGVTDKTGTYRTAPPMARDSRPHTVVVVADGYTARMFENAIKIEPTDPEVTSVETVQLKKR